MSETRAQMDAAGRKRAAEAIKKIPFARVPGIELVEIEHGKAVLKLKMRFST